MKFKLTFPLSAGLQLRFSSRTRADIGMPRPPMFDIPCHDWHPVSSRLLLVREEGQVTPTLSEEEDVGDRVDNTYRLTKTMSTMYRTTEQWGHTYRLTRSSLRCELYRRKVYIYNWGTVQYCISSGWVLMDVACSCNVTMSHEPLASSCDQWQRLWATTLVLWANASTTTIRMRMVGRGY